MLFNTIFNKLQFDFQLAQPFDPVFHLCDMKRFNHIKSFFKVFFAIFLLANVFLFISCQENIKEENQDNSYLDSISFQHSMKGWEMYSWQKDLDWNYSVLAGTNRLKTLDEVTNNKIIVKGKDALKKLLGKMPEKEEIFWVGKGWAGISWTNSSLNLALPDIQTVNEIKDFCIQKKLVLNIDSGP